MCELCGDLTIQHIFGEMPSVKPIQKKLDTTSLKGKIKKVNVSRNKPRKFSEEAIKNIAKSSNLDVHVTKPAK
jgi:hypothetical protein